MKIQMCYLEEWDSLERDHINSLSGALLDLEASTLRVPLTTGATVCQAIKSFPNFDHSISFSLME